MGTAVLRSQDCLKNRLHLDYHASGPPPPAPMNPAATSSTSSRRKPSRSPPAKQLRQARPKPGPSPAQARRRSVSPVDTNDKENLVKQPHLVMGQVTILKRGEGLKPNAAPSAPYKAADLRSSGADQSVLCSTNRLGPDPEILPKFPDLRQVYAGPAYVVSSPAPSSLPIPAFFLKKTASVEEPTNTEEIATRGLRCLLRLDEIA